MSCCPCIVNLPRCPMGPLVHNVHIQERFAAEEMQWSEALSQLFGKNRFNSDKALMAQSLSHFLLWRHIATTEGERHLIFEDTQDVEENFIDRWNREYYGAMPLEFKVLFLGGVEADLLPEWGSGLVKRPVNRRWSAHRATKLFQHDVVEDLDDPKWKEEPSELFP